MARAWILRIVILIACLAALLFACIFTGSLWYKKTGAREAWARTSDAAVLAEMDGDYAAAEAKFKKALEFAERSSDPILVARTLRELGGLYTLTNNEQGVRNCARRALAILKSESLDVAAEHEWELRQLNFLFRDVYDWEQMAECGEKLRGAGVPGSGAYAEDTAGLARAYYGLGKRAESVELYEEALTGLEKVYGPFDNRVASCLSGYGVVLKSMGRMQEGMAASERAAAIREKLKNAGQSPISGEVDNDGA